MVDDAQFFAWLDGELDPAEAAAVAAEVERDPALQRLAEQHRAMQTRLRGAFDSLLDEPVRSGDRPHGRVVDLAGARARRAARAAPPLWKQAAALAATLTIGVFAGNALTSESSSPVEVEAGHLVAAADLEGALYAQLASAPAEEGPRVGLTFRDRSGSICRTFTADAASGLACRAGGDWRIQGLFQGPEGQGGDYRMAAGPDPRLMALVESMIAGQPLDAAAEAEAMRRGWR